MHYGLVVDASFGWQEVECAEEQDDMRELGKVENQAGCCVLDKLQGFDGTTGEPSQTDVRGQVPGLGPAPLPV